MGKKLPHTPRGRIRSWLRRLWMMSRERASAIKRENGCCERCGAKQSEAKGREVRLEVHHRNGIKWEELIDLIFRYLLCDPKDLEVLCTKCHGELHKQHEHDDWLD